MRFKATHVKVINDARQYSLNINSYNSEMKLILRPDSDGVGSKKVTRGQLWDVLYRLILFYITHKDLGIYLMNIFQTNVIVEHKSKL